MLLRLPFGRVLSLRVYKPMHPTAASIAARRAVREQIHRVMPEESADALTALLTGLQAGFEEQKRRRAAG